MNAGRGWDGNRGRGRHGRSRTAGTAHPRGPEHPGLRDAGDHSRSGGGHPGRPVGRILHLPDPAATHRPRGPEGGSLCLGSAGPVHRVAGPGADRRRTRQGPVVRAGPLRPGQYGVLVPDADRIGEGTWAREHHRWAAPLDRPHHQYRSRCGDPEDVRAAAEPALHHDGGHRRPGHDGPAMLRCSGRGHQLPRGEDLPGPAGRVGHRRPGLPVDGPAAAGPRRRGPFADARAHPLSHRPLPSRTRPPGLRGRRDRGRAAAGPTRHLAGGLRHGAAAADPLRCCLVLVGGDPGLRPCGRPAANGRWIVGARLAGGDRRGRAAHHRRSRLDRPPPGPDRGGPAPTPRRLPGGRGPGVGRRDRPRSGGSAGGAGWPFRGGGGHRDRAGHRGDPAGAAPPGRGHRPSPVGQRGAGGTTDRARHAGMERQGTVRAGLPRSRVRPGALLRRRPRCRVGARRSEAAAGLRDAGCRIPGVAGGGRGRAGRAPGRNPAGRSPAAGRRGGRDPCGAGVPGRGLDDGPR